MAHRHDRRDWNALTNSDSVHNVAPRPSQLFPTASRQIGSSRAAPSGVTSTARIPLPRARRKWRGSHPSWASSIWSWRASGGVPGRRAQLKDVVAYARERGVKTFVWYIRSAIQDPKILEQNLELCNRVGSPALRLTSSIMSTKR